MEHVDWDAAFSVGVLLIDTQHKRLVDLLNKSITAAHESDCSETLDSLLSGLIQYAGYHFKTEGDFMEKYGYPDTEEHTQEHQAFAEKMIAYKESDVDDKHTLAVTINLFLKDWLINHIAGSDMALGEYLNSQGVQ